MTVDFVKIFFYGSFMDLEILGNLGIIPRQFETAKLREWDITFSPMATLVPRERGLVYGLLAELPRTEVEALYSRDDLKLYRPVDVTVETGSDTRVSARCYVSESSAGQNPSVEYLRRVTLAAEKLGLPPEYLMKLRRTPTTQANILREKVE